MRTSLTQSGNEKDKNEVMHFDFKKLIFNNLTTDKCGCLWNWTSSLRRNSLVDHYL